MGILHDIYGGGYTPGESLEKRPKDLSGKRWAFTAKLKKSWFWNL